MTKRGKGADAEGRNNSISARWTSLKPPNPYIAISDGRSLFYPKDLLGQFDGWPIGFTADGSFYYGARTTASNVYIARLDSTGAEFEMPIRRGINRFFWQSDTSIPVPEPDVEMAFAFSYLRDAAQGRPGHLWANDLRSAEEALAASAACLTYGTIANLDIDEPTIPNPMFTAALQMGERVSRYLAHTRPVRWAAIHFSERGRDLCLTDQENMYRKVIVPCWQSFQALSRIGAPIGIVTDEQIAKNELDGYKVLVLAAPGVLTAEEQGNVDAFQANGGIVIELVEDSRWYTDGRQSAIRAEFLNNVLAQAGQPPVSVRNARDGVHAVAVKHPDDADRVVVCVTNEFTWLGNMQKHRLDGTTPCNYRLY